MNTGHEVEQLKRRHHQLEQSIDSECARPMPDELRISALKKEKLNIKDQLQAIEH